MSVIEEVPIATPYLQPIIVTSLLSFAIVLLAVNWLIEMSRAIRLAEKLPGPKRLPIVGNGMMVYGIHPKELFKKLLELDVYGPVIRATLGNEVIVFMYHPRDIEIILGSSVHLQKSTEYRYFQPWLGDGLLISSGEKWRTHRKIIAPTFHMNILKSFVPLFYENSRDLVQRLREKVGQEFDCHDYLSELTVNILMETAMGVKRADEKKSSFEYAMAVLEMCNIIHQRQYNLFLRLDFFFQFTNFAKKQKKLLAIIHNLTNRVIQTKKNEAYEKICNDVVENQTVSNKAEKEKPEPNVNASTNTNTNSMRYVRDDLDEIEANDVGEKKRLAFLDLLLELSRNGVQLTEEEIREEVNTIMFEGHDTTAAGSSFVLCMLGIHQDVQQRVFEEIDEIFKGSDRQCTFQDTLEMKYLERVILETIRMFPPVPAIARKLTEDVQLVTQEGIMPKDTTVVIPIIKVHRLEEFYPNPEKFNPDNFLPENTQSRHYYAFIPFSAGPRSCVGRKYAMLKLKVLISTIIRNYKIYSDLTEDKMNLQIDIILKRTDGFRISIEPRNKTTCSA